MQRTVAKPIVALFCGTGSTLGKKTRGYVPESDLVAKPIPFEQPKVTNMGMEELAVLVAPENEVSVTAYNGCHLRGGGCFAYGVEEPARHLLKRVGEQLGQHDEIRVALTAHSRGCVSALMFAKLVAADPTLRDKVKITLDLRDPVPGNFAWFAAIDAAKTTVTRKLYDMTDCACIQSAYITVQDLPYLPMGYDVLIPTFSECTKLQIEYLNGGHAIQQIPGFSDQQIQSWIEGNKKHPHIDYRERGGKKYFKGLKFSRFHYHLGILKSLQIYLEHGIPIDRYWLHEYIFRTGRVELEALAVKMRFHDGFIDGNKEALLPFIQELQSACYEKLIECEKTNFQEFRDHQVLTRKLLFDGQFNQRSGADVATHFNDRHAALMQAVHARSEQVQQLVLDKPYVAYSGKRQDINPRQQMVDKYSVLTTLLDELIVEERKKRKPEAYMKVLSNMRDCLKSDSQCPEAIYRNVTAAAKIADENKALFAPEKTPKLHIFLHLLSSLFSAFLYTVTSAIASAATNGTGRFWRTKSQIWRERINDCFNQFDALNEAHRRSVGAASNEQSDLPTNTP